MRRYTWIAPVCMLAACASVAPKPLSSPVAAEAPSRPVTGVMQQPTMTGRQEHFVWCASCPDLTPKVAATSDDSTAGVSSSLSFHYPSTSPTSVIYFSIESARIYPELTGQFKSMVSHVRDGDVIEIRGYTDSSGNKPYNQRLAMARARAVRHWMKSHIKDHVTYTLRAFGKCCYLRHPELSPENRRVEVTIKKGEKRNASNNR